MSSAPPRTATPDLPHFAPTPVPDTSRHRRRTDLTVAALSLAIAIGITINLWLAPNHRAIRWNRGDQALFEWLLAFGAHTLHDWHNPLFTTLLNVPDGVNLSVNTSITVLAFVFAPLTMLIGPPATFAVILTLNLAASAYAWYWLFSRHLVASPLAAATAGIFCGFAPGLVSHANGHLNWTAQWLVPLLIWRVLALREPGRAGRNGTVLGVLVAAAFSIAAEELFFTALACGVFLGGWALAKRAEARALAPAFLRGLAVGGGVAAALLAYPLWLHFFGPQRYHGTGFSHLVHSEDIAAYGVYPDRSLGGLAGLNVSLAPNRTEENSFLGLPLLILAVACFLLLWRRAADRAVPLALGVTALVFMVLSFGPRAQVFNMVSAVPLPYAALGALPVFDAALPARLALVVTPAVGALLASTLDLLRPVRPPRRLPRPWLIAFAVALVPLVPIPLQTVERDPVPPFIAEGMWRDYVSDGGVLAPVPPASDVLPDGQRWQAAAFASGHGTFAIPAGFFLGPGGPDGRGRIGPVPRTTDGMLREVAETGVVPPISDADRATARADLRHWRAEAVVLGDTVHGAQWPVHRDALLAVTTALLGPGERVGGVTVWRRTW